MLISFYGGTFDPIHYGHIKPVIALARLINLKKVYLLPNNLPPHKPQPIASSQQRLNMVRLAISDLNENLFTIDERELFRKKPSWTIETFESIINEYGKDSSLAFIIGQDSLLSLSEWHRIKELISLCHILVCSRPGYKRLISTNSNYWITKRLVNSPKKLYQQSSGLIYCASTPEYSISGSDIRKRYQEGRSCHGLLPISVQHYIYEQGLYR